MGQTSSSRSEASHSRESSLPEARPSRSSSNNSFSEGSFVFSSFHMPSQDLPDISKPIHNWLSMDSTSKEKHALHAKRCILTPYFLFSKEDENGGKLLSWLQQKQLIPKQSDYKLLSDKHISVADCAEEAIDMILSLMSSSCFLYDAFHVVEQTKECDFLSDALNMAKNCHLIDVLLQNFSKFLPSNKLPRDDAGLIILVLLNQAMNHIQKVGDQTDAFEQLLKDNSGKCDALKLKGNSFFNAKKYNKACSCYSQAIKLRPFDAVLYGNRAQSYLSAAKYREALSDARRAICLNPSWEKGYFRYAKAYYHLGFHDKAIAINLQAQKRCSQTSELIQQANLFTKGRSCSPSHQPTFKRQRISSVERRVSPVASDEEEGDYSDLPELIEDDTDGELDEPGPSVKKDSTNKTSRTMTIKSEYTMDCKRVQCSCSHCIPKTTMNRKLKRNSDAVHNHPGDDNDDCNNKCRHNRTVTKCDQGGNPCLSESKSNEACALSSIRHCHTHDDDDDDECCTDCEVSRTKGLKTRSTSSRAKPHSLINDHRMQDDYDDTRDIKIRENNDASTNQIKYTNMSSEKDSPRGSSSNIQHVSNVVPSLHTSTQNTLDSSKRSDHMGGDCDGCECDSCSSSSCTQGMADPSEGALGLQPSNDSNDDMDGCHSRDGDDDDDDDQECICGFCHINDDDEWEDIDDDDDDDDSFTDMDLSDLPDLDEPSDEDDDEDDDDDDDDGDEAYLFNPLFHMFAESVMPSAPIPPNLVFGSEILLLALIRQFIESHSEFQSEDTPPGALPEVIESLVKKKVTKDLIDTSASCCICQNDYVIDEMITCLPCNHVYHGPCITTWLKMHATCPTCRDVLPH